MNWDRCGGCSYGPLCGRLCGRSGENCFLEGLADALVVPIDEWFGDGVSVVVFRDGTDHFGALAEYGASMGANVKLGGLEPLRHIGIIIPEITL